MLLEREQAAFWAIWLAVGTIGLFVMGAFYFLVHRASRIISAQRQRLAGNLDAARRLASQNRALTAASEQLRHEASLANEQLLGQVGTELHDGPLQLLTLLIMQLRRTPGKSGHDGADANLRLAGEAMEELRNISTGLVLPELESADLADTVIMAITRHQQLTANNVTCEVGPLPSAVGTDVKICVYRLLQEGLTNAYLHGEPGARVSVETRGDLLVLSVVNTPRPGVTEPNARRARLGLRGMRFRVESLGGRLDLTVREGRTVVLSAALPIEPPAASTQTAVLAGAAG
jgi:signal transduction histidine kinase